MARALLHLNSTATAILLIAFTQFQMKNQNARVLILQGTGRVGGSTAVVLSKLCPDLQIVVGSRKRVLLRKFCIPAGKGAATVATLAKNSEFAEVNSDNEGSLLMAFRAGPFQQAPKCTVMEAAIETKTAYIDVCDDTSYSQPAKSFKDKAMAANIPAITSGGIYTVVSNGAFMNILVLQSVLEVQKIKYMIE
ncbi:Sacchrp dh NADP domain-containing protein [Citrus sinensis]|nr:Sacchrp dh NADP domain-containing protein [Citrus sinensis]